MRSRHRLVLPTSSSGNILLLLFAPGLAFVAFAVSFIRDAYAEIIVVDPIGKTLRIQEDGTETVITWNQILCLQLCFENVPDDEEMNGYQLNLVWKDSTAAIKRRCLLKSYRRHVISLGEQYRRYLILSWLIICRKSEVYWGRVVIPLSPMRFIS